MLYLNLFFIRGVFLPKMLNILNFREQNPTPAMIFRQRQLLLANVKNEVQQRLDTALHKSVQLNLLKGQENQNLGRIWDIEVKITKRPTFSLSPETSILQVFEDANRKLLIVGADGAGKTTTLLKLANNLISLAEEDINQPIPVLVNLSTWKSDRQSITKWLAAQINWKYNINLQICQQWLENSQLLLLFDGIDELETEDQELCIQEINQLILTLQGQLNLVVCARLEEYKKCPSRLKLQGVIWLRPLKENKIREYLLNVRSRELWENIQDDPNLLELAKNPLLLNIMTLAYEEILIHSWKRFETEEDRRNYILNAYIRRQLNKEISDRWYGKNKEPRTEKTRHWLMWLAEQMQHNLNDEIFLDKIPIFWLQNPQDIQIYKIIFKLLNALICGLMAWVFFQIIIGVKTAAFFGIIFAIIGAIMGEKFPSSAYIQNFTIRLICWWHSYIPWNYGKFLNYSTERLFLQRIGKRYRFIHNILREHFAKMPVD